jgi:hypothetical protein
VVSGTAAVATFLAGEGVVVGLGGVAFLAAIYLGSCCRCATASPTRL